MTNGGNQLHLNKGFNLSDLITVGVLIVGGIITLTTLQINLQNIGDRMQETVENQVRRDGAQDAQIQRFRTEMRADVRDIQQKLDRLLENLLIEQGNYRSQ